MQIDEKSSPHADLAFLRALAEAGRDVPLTCGPFMLSAGIVFGIASLAAWLVSLARLHLPPIAITGVWLVACLVHIPITWILSRRSCRLDGATATVNRAVAVVWSGLSLGIAAMFIAGLILQWRFQSPLIWMAFPSTMLAVYGAGWSATAFISGQRWLLRVAAGSLAAAILLAALAGSADTFLIYAGVLVLLIAIPGWVLVHRQARSV